MPGASQRLMQPTSRSECFGKPIEAVLPTAFALAAKVFVCPFFLREDDFGLRVSFAKCKRERAFPVARSPRRSRYTPRVPKDVRVEIRHSRWSLQPITRIVGGTNQAEWPRALPRACRLAISGTLTAWFVMMILPQPGAFRCGRTSVPKTHAVFESRSKPVSSRLVRAGNDGCGR